MSIIEKALERSGSSERPKRKGAGEKTTGPDVQAGLHDNRSPDNEESPSSANEGYRVDSSDGDAAGLDLSADFAVARAEATTGVEAPSLDAADRSDQAAQHAAVSRLADSESGPDAPKDDGMAPMAGTSSPLIGEPSTVFKEAQIPEIKGWVSSPGQRKDAMVATVEAPDSVSAAPQTKSRLVDVNLDRLEALGMLTPKSNNSLLAEQYRAIKRPVLMQVSGDPSQRPANSNLVMIASALPNEGKTSTAINLAISMAQERDQTVLLVDGDVAKSDITQILDIEAELGLTDLLADSSLTVADVMIKTSIPKLSVVPAGTRMPNVTELYASRNMRELMADFAQRYSDRIVVLDSPPLLAATGASVLASLAGQILLVIEAVRTPQRAVNEALRLLGPLDNIGVILNKVRQTPSEYGYGYGYGYGDGS